MKKFEDNFMDYCTNAPINLNSKNKIKIKGEKITKNVLEKPENLDLEKLDSENPNSEKPENPNLEIIKNYKDLNMYNYNISTLKSSAKYHKLKISGSKNELIKRLFSFLYLSSHIIKIQRLFRTFLLKKIIKYYGPAFINRKLCTNNTDFITLEPFNEINCFQFISYKNPNGFIYGFDIISFYTTFYGNKPKINPYDRSIIPDEVIENFTNLMRLCMLLNIKINLKYVNDTSHFSSKKLIEFRAMKLFDNINNLGICCNYQWFHVLNRHQLYLFIDELLDIWKYRAELTNETRMKICHPHGNPFIHLNFDFIYYEENILTVKKVILEVMEKMVNLGIDNSNKILGCYYVLGALTLVNKNAASAIPWLYQSFG